MQTKNIFKYLFRFCCDPYFNKETEIHSLQKFVKESLIDDVMVFVNTQEINTGHMQKDEQMIYLSMIQEIQEILAPEGITTSVNQWHTIMHGDAGKRLHNDQNFRLMVDVNGKQASLCVCPECENWQKYIISLYADYAKLHPWIVWVEDDFRLHNHEPLTWGGCFCDKHMELFSKLAGKKLSRDEFVQGILEPGSVHPYRKIWLDVSRATMVNLAKRIGDAVHSVTDDVQIGLMSSAPHIHAAEGRDWSGILKGLAGEDATPIDRIHLPGYVEQTPSVYMMNFIAVSMLTRAMIPEETEVYPELENFPYGRYTKSRKFTRFQMLSAMPLDISGITIDLYDLNGNGIDWGEGYQETLKEVKPFLNHLTELGVFHKKRLGVRIMFAEKSSYTIHTTEGKSMEELYPHESFFASLLTSFGIPCIFCSDNQLEGEIVAVSGQYFRNLSEIKIRMLFEKNFMILDGMATVVLFEMGLGELLNLENVFWMKQNDGSYTFEQVMNGKEYCGKDNARASALLLASDAVSCSYTQANEIMTGFFDSSRELTAIGLTLVSDRVLVYPFGNIPSCTDIPRMLLNNIRQSLIQDVLSRQKNAPIYIVGDPYLYPFWYEDDNGSCMYIVNAQTDDVPMLSLVVGERDILLVEAYFSENNLETELTFKRYGAHIILPIGIRSMECVLLKFKER